jgi:hypothetical protein
MSTTRSTALNAGFCIAVVLSVLLFCVRDAFYSEPRFHLAGATIILHADQSVVVRDSTDRLKTYTWAKQIDVRLLQFACMTYIVCWTSWRLLQLVRRRQKPARGFEVIQ